MNRTTAREIAIQLGFAAAAADVPAGQMLEHFFDKEYYASLAGEDELFSQYPEEKQLDYIRRLSLLMEEKRAEIDGYIQNYSKSWKISRISKTALSVLRCAVCEILYMDDIPNSAAINEAVELAKGYDEPDTVAFVNGVLGGFMRGEIEKSEE